MLPDGTLPAVAALVVLLTGLGLGAVALTGVRPLRRVSLVLCGVGAPAWLLLNGPVEGAVLTAVTSERGLTLGDLLSVTAVLVGGLVLRDLRHDRERR